jgi:Protein of unknown function (DUF2442)
MVTEKEFELASMRGSLKMLSHPRATEAHYDRKIQRIFIHLSSGLDLVFPPAVAQGLEDATPTDLDVIEISPSGMGVHFPALDAGLYIPSLLQGFFGSKKWTAARLGAEGGKAKSHAKTAASRENGKMGGRPKHHKVAAGRS